MKLPRIASAYHRSSPRAPVAVQVGTIEPSILVINNKQYVDKDVLEFAELAQFDPIVLITTNKGQATGTLVDVGKGAGKVILTAAHVIEDGIQKVYLKGAPLNEDEGSPSQEVAIASAKANPKFKRGDDTTRAHDYGVIVLRKSVDSIRPYRISKTCPTEIQQGIINVGGFGDYANTQGGQSSDLRKRVFHSLVKTSKDKCSVLYSENGEQLVENPEQGIYWGYPYQGDSGGPVFANGVFNEVAGIVSGTTEDGFFAYARPSAADILALL